MLLRASFRRAAIGGIGVALIAGLIDPIAWTHRHMARAGDDLLPPRVASATPALDPGVPRARPFPPRGSIVRRSAEHTEANGGWWLGTTGIALALAVCGGVSLATRRGWRWPQVYPASPLRVVGRTSLTPRHTVHLLSIGPRVLIVGTGPQGAPSLLGELTDPDELQRLGSRRGDDRDEVQDRNSSAPDPATSALPQSVVVNWRRPRGNDR